MAAIIHHGIERMYGPEPEDVFYYLTLYNENYVMPAQPDDPEVARRDHRGPLPVAEAPDGDRPPATILFSGPAQGAARQAAGRARRALRRRPPSCGAPRPTSGCARRRWRPSAGTGCTPRRRPRTPARHRAAGRLVGPDRRRHRLHAGGARPDRPLGPDGRRYTSLGTDGFGRSDTREALRRFFETDAAHVVVATLNALAACGAIDRQLVAEAITFYGLDADAADPWAP